MSWEHRSSLSSAFLAVWLSQTFVWLLSPKLQRQPRTGLAAVAERPAGWDSVLSPACAVPQQDWAPAEPHLQDGVEEGTKGPWWSALRSHKQEGAGGSKVSVRWTKVAAAMLWHWDLEIWAAASINCTAPPWSPDKELFLSVLSLWPVQHEDFATLIDKRCRNAWDWLIRYRSLCVVHETKTKFW